MFGIATWVWMMAAGASPALGLPSAFPPLPLIRVEFNGNVAVSGARLAEAVRPAFPATADSAGLAAIAARVLDVYREDGFLRAEVEARAHPDSTLGLEVREGGQVRVDTLRLEGCRGIPEERVRRGLELRGGKPLTERRLLEDADRILALYENEGFPFATVTPGSFELAGSGQGAGANAVAVTFVVREGSMARVAGLEVRGAGVTRRETVERTMRLRRGAVYRQRDTDLGLERVGRAGLFREIGEPALRPSSSGRDVTVLLDVSEGPMNSIEAGMGYVPRGGAVREGYVTGTLDLRLGNIAGTGRSAEVHWRRFSPGSASWRVGYREPWLPRVPLAVAASIHQEVRDSTFTTRGAELALEWPVSYSVDLTLAGVRERTGTGARGFGFVETSRRNALSLGARFDRRDDRANPRRGATLALQGGLGRREVEREEVGLGTVKESVRESRLASELAGYLPVGRSTVLAFESDVRAVRNRGIEVPFYELYFLGGSHGPRGYAEDQFFGETAARGAFETRWLTGARSRYHLFLDLGYDVRRGEGVTHWGYGAGLRLESGLGLLGLDLGLPLGGTLSDAKLHLRLAQQW